MSKCGWCGHETLELTDLRVEEVRMMSWDGEKETEADTEFSEVFCCRGCLWAFEFESHQIWGMTEQEIRTHLIEEHGMAYPTGAPAGNMSSECRRKFEAVAQAIDRFLGLE